RDADLPRLPAPGVASLAHGPGRNVALAEQGGVRARPAAPAPGDSRRGSRARTIRRPRPGGHAGWGDLRRLPDCRIRPRDQRAERPLPRGDGGAEYWEDDRRAVGGRSWVSAVR